MTEFVFRFLGTYQVSADVTPVTDFHSDKVRALLAYLVLEPYEHPRTELAALLWPVFDDQSARANLRNTLHRLRHALDAVVPDSSTILLTASRQSICFNLQQATVDVHRFLSTVGNAHANKSAAEVDRLEAAVALYRGELLAGFGVADAPAFEEWLLLRREALHQQALMAMHMLTTLYETASSYERAHSVASRLLTLDPFREETHRQLMRLLARMGQPDSALAQFDRLRQLLQQEIGVAPAAETLTLAQLIASGAFDGGQEGARRQEDKRTGGQEPVLSLLTEDRFVGRAVIQSSSHLVPRQTHLLDLSEIPRPGAFFGREQEQRQIAQWLVQERRQVVAILGMGGMGKTTLIAHSIYDMTEHTDRAFDAVVWRSLVNAPPLSELLPPLLQALSQQRLSQIPEQVNEQLRLLLGYLRERCVLLILDNLESILEPGEAGAYRSGYEPYGQLLQHMATFEHRSHLVLTSRERPRGFARLERDGYPVKSLLLTGLEYEASHQLFLQRGVRGHSQEETQLIARYSGNPLALKLVADTVDEIFGGDMAEFLTDDTLIFDDIRAVLDQHFARLTNVGQQILFWLAIERELTPLATLRANLLNPPPQRVLLETLRDLQRHSLVERHEGGFVLQNVITEYLTDRLVSEAYIEISTGPLNLLHHHALVTVQRKEYVRQSQIRVILEPLLQRLETVLTRAGLQDRLHALIRHLQTQYGRRPSYAGGTILNAMIHLGLNLTGVDLSGICLWQTDLRHQEIHRLNLAGADLAHSVFTQTFGRIEAVAVSPDGQRFAIGGDGGYIRVYDMASRQFLLVLSGHTSIVAGLAFGPNGNLLASVGHDGAARLWDLERQEQIQLWHTQGAMQAVGFSPDGALLIGGGDTNVVYLWDVASGLLRATLEGHKGSIRSLAVHPKGNYLASGSNDEEIRLWELYGDRAKSDSVVGSNSDETEGPAAGVTTIATTIATQHNGSLVIALAFSPNGLLLAAGNSSGRITLRKAESLELLASFQAHSVETRSLVFGPESRTLYSGGGGGPSSIRIWDVDHNELLARLLQDETTWSLALTPDGKTLVSGREDGTVHLWNVSAPSQPTLIHSLYGYRMSLTSLAWSQCGRWLATGDVHGEIVVWGVSEDSPTQRHRLRCEDGPVTAVAFSPDGNLLASACGAGTQHSLRIWDPVSGTSQATMRLDVEHYSVAFAHAGKTLISSGQDGIVRFWEVGAPEPPATSYQLYADPGRFYARCDRTGTLMVTCGKGKPVAVWDIAATDTAPPTLLHTLTGYRVNWCAAIDTNAKLLAYESPAYAIALWHIGAPGEAELLHSLKGHTRGITSVAFSPDGSRLISCSFDRSVRLWDVETGRQLAVLGEHPQFALDVAFSPDGSRAASIGKEGLLCIWNIQSGEQEHLLKAPAPYEGMNITGVTGISEAQRAALKELGAVEA